MGGPTPLGLLRRNVPDRLKRVIGRATRDDLGDRYKDVEAFKRAVDKATPAISFAYIDQSTMQSTDGKWSIQWNVGRNGHNVEVRHNGRRDNRYAVRSVDEKAVIKHIGVLVAGFASA